MSAYAYLRVSTEEQTRTGHGLAAQRAAVAAEAERRGWSVQWAVDDGVSASVRPADRPALGPLLERLEAGDVLVCARLDRIARSSLDFAQLLAQANAAGWQLVLLDLGVDMTTPGGKFVASIMAAVAELERELIRERTRAALAAARSRGVRLGRKPSLPPEVRRAIVQLRYGGASYAAIAQQLNRENVPTAQGGARWYPATVRGVVAVGEVA